MAVCCFHVLPSKTQRLNDLAKVAQEAILPKIKFRVPDIQGAEQWITKSYSLLATLEPKIEQLIL